ncbi:hypothetical protein [Georgenia subflava]|uniref:EcsC family protein n=1 Tax=Georgenia subflava TaxID=1622177 RepID=A0A6N7EMZ3_9MICO|nr:hypothetical protein [Georgenia subflava]MPV38498.1 hypothetical protein [Georgenia subflava]
MSRSRRSTDLTTTGADPQDADLAKRSSLLDRLLDRAVAGSSGAESRVAELRRENPDASPEQLLRKLEKRYLRRVSRLGGAVGAVAAVPALGTAAALVLTTAQTAAFLRSSAAHVMAVASLHGIRVDDVERRRTLLLASLLGEEGAHAVSGQLGLGTLYWGKAALTKLPIGLVRSVNKGLTRRLLTAGAARGGLLALGRLAPFGIGAVIGYKGTKTVGKNVLEGARKAFGPVPHRFPVESGANQ